MYAVVYVELYAKDKFMKSIQCVNWDHIIADSADAGYMKLCVCFYVHV